MAAALALLQLEQFAEARDDLTAIIDHGEDIYKISARYALALVHFNLGHDEIARQLWREAEVTWPAAPHEHYSSIARILRRTFEDMRRSARGVLHP